MNNLNKSILIVDDSATVRLYLSRLLTGWGYRVDVAITGYEGLEKALSATYGLILSDINMPTMSGYAMVTALRKEVSTQAVPVIMISTESKDHDASLAYTSGANLYLVKPVQPDVLRRFVKFSIGAAV